MILFAMLGEQEKAYGYVQISMYDNIMNLLANAACYLQINMAQQQVCRETIERIEHGDAYFNRIEAWFGNELLNGTNAPCNRKVVLEDAKRTLDVPPFTVLNGIPEFEKIRNKLKEIN